MAKTNPSLNITIHRAKRSDVDTITTFNLNGAKESTGKDLDPDQVRAGVSQVVRGHPDFYLVARVEGQPAAHLKVHHHWYDWYDSLFWWIEHVYVVPEFRRKGISQRLVEHVKELAHESGDVKVLLLHVSENNLKAISSYEKFGFKRSVLFPMSFDIMR
jgi:GNAT superfamily N-acetyltransferase